MADPDSTKPKKKKKDAKKKKDGKETKEDKTPADEGLVERGRPPSKGVSRYFSCFAKPNAEPLPAKTKADKKETKAAKDAEDATKKTKADKKQAVKKPAAQKKPAAGCFGGGSAPNVQHRFACVYERSRSREFPEWLSELGKRRSSGGFLEKSHRDALRARVQKPLDLPNAQTPVSHYGKLKGTGIATKFSRWQAASRRRRKRRVLRRSSRRRN